MFQNLPYTIETLSPIHIGSGITLNKHTDYFIENNNLYKIKPETVLRHLGSSRIDAWVDAINANTSILPLLKRDSAFNLANADEILALKGKKTEQIKEHIRNNYNRNPIIPGSSLKGALRTALIYKSFQNFKFTNSYRNKFAFSKDVAHYEKKIVADNPNARLNPNNDIFKYLQVSDTEANIHNLSVLDHLLLNERRNGLSIDYRRSLGVESLEGQFQGFMRINERFWKNSFTVNNIQEFINQINNYTTIRLQSLKEDIEIIQEEGLIDSAISSHLLELIQTLLRSMNTNTIVFRMSKGSGWDFMTGAWLKDNTGIDNWDDIKKYLTKSRYLEFPYPKSKILTKLNDTYMLPGFVKITFL